LRIHLSVYNFSFVDRDMVMRYHWGLGVGHVYGHHSSSNATASGGLGTFKEGENESPKDAGGTANRSNQHNETVVQGRDPQKDLHQINCDAGMANPAGASKDRSSISKTVNAHNQDGEQKTSNPMSDGTDMASALGDAKQDESEAWEPKNVYQRGGMRRKALIDGEGSDSDETDSDYDHDNSTIGPAASGVDDEGNSATKDQKSGNDDQRHAEVELELEEMYGGTHDEELTSYD
jgi:hypothetical protein